MLGSRQTPGGPTGRSQDLTGGVVTNLGVVSMSLVMLQKAVLVISFFLFFVFYFFFYLCLQ